MRFLKATCMAAAFMAAALAHASDESGATWGLGLNTGFNTYGMGNLNQFLSGGDAGFTVNSGEQLGLNGAVKYRFAKHWLAEFEANYLSLRGSATDSQQGITTQTLLDADASEYLLDAAYLFPQAVPGLEFSAGIGLGVIVLTRANLAFNYPDYPDQNVVLPLDGSGFDGKIFVGAAYYFVPSLSLGLDLGYRYANLWPVNYTLNGNRTPLLNADGSVLTFDYSGFNSQLALVWWI